MGKQRQKLVMTNQPLQKWRRHKCELANTVNHAELCQTLHDVAKAANLLGSFSSKTKEPSTMHKWHYEFSAAYVASRLSRDLRGT